MDHHSLSSRSDHAQSALQQAPDGTIHGLRQPTSASSFVNSRNSCNSWLLDPSPLTILAAGTPAPSPRPGPPPLTPPSIREIRATSPTDWPWLLDPSPLTTLAAGTPTPLPCPSPPPRTPSSIREIRATSPTDWPWLLDPSPLTTLAAGKPTPSPRRRGATPPSVQRAPSITPWLTPASGTPPAHPTESAMLARGSRSGRAGRAPGSWPRRAAAAPAPYSPPALLHGATSHPWAQTSHR